MYLRKLEIIGFKSFLNKTSLHFEPGITAVVGPNGCGKSNIFDSIRWVLGEQSVKSMRGSSMEDVIFNGTDSKEPLSMAEVSLTFDNSNNFFPIEHNEVIITRRIFRSGESEYLLNKTQVRLKDILELLMGTGIGAESYSLIPQGKIDLILSSKPEDRRLVFDEASGITKYKAQKKEALRRVDETEQNLLRVNDIILEVKRQIGSLERQANKARRFKEVFEELKSKELTLAVSQKKELETNINTFTDELNKLSCEENRLTEIIKERENQINNLQAELRDKEEAIFQAKNELVNLNNLISRNKERVNYNKERILELNNTKKQLEKQLEQAKQRLIVDEEKLNSLKTEYTTIKKSINEKTEILKENESLLNNISHEIKSSLENIARAKKDILNLAAGIAHVKNTMADSSSKKQIGLAREKRLKIEKAKINEEKAAIEIDINAVQQEVNNLENGFQNLSLEISRDKEKLNAEKLSLNDIDSEIETLEKRSLSLQSQKQFIQELQAKYEDISESMNAVIYLDKMPQEKINGLVIKIKEYLTDGSGHFPTHHPEERNDEGSYEEKTADNTINLKISGEAKQFDLDTQKIEERIHQIEQRIEELKNTKSQKQALINELENSLTALEKKLREQEITLINKKNSYQSILEQFNRVKDEEELINTELSEVNNDIFFIDENLQKLGLELNQLEAEQKNKENSIVNEENGITVQSKQKEGILVVIAQLKTEIESLTSRIESDDDTLKMMELRYLQDKENVSALTKQIEDIGQKNLSLDSEIQEIENKIIQTNLMLADRSTGLKETENNYQTGLQYLQDSMKKLELDKNGLDNLKEGTHKLQIQNKDIEFKYLTLKDRISQVYKIDLSDESQLPKEEAAEINIPVLSEEIQKLKEKVDSYGSVNLVAIEEYDELKKRYDFLIQQQTDLITAKDSLHEAILKINRTTKKMFLETFEQIRVEFRNYFKLLFNGGDAQVYLIDEKDPLESGIEIICRPPGKKLQNVLLLSGGEKSMSAIALIFAIFKIKPAPFCVLDEIDAALDEANVDRFGKALHEFAKTTQFIVITHNKKTIANADIMYGITMEESGVSKIVSVKFAQNNNLLDKRVPINSNPISRPVLADT